MVVKYKNIEFLSASFAFSTPMTTYHAKEGQSSVEISVIVETEHESPTPSPTTSINNKADAEEVDNQMDSVAGIIGCQVMN